MFKISFLDKTGQRQMFGSLLSSRESAEGHLECIIKYNTPASLAKYYGLQVLGSFKVEEIIEPQWNDSPFDESDFLSIDETDLYNRISPLRSRMNSYSFRSYWTNNQRYQIDV